MPNETNKMTREIKFRAWCSNYSEEPKSRMEYGVMIGENGGYLSVEAGWDIHGEKMDVPVMQFTGLLDKNGKGKEVYEGDLIRMLPKGYEPKEIYQVIWDEKELMWALTKSSDDRNSPLSSCLKDFEIIGNTWENPEPLTQ